MILRNSIQKIVGIACLIVIVSCNVNVDQQNVEDIELPVVTVSGQDWVVFSKEYAEETMYKGMWLTSNRIVEGHWQPSADDIMELEGNLAEYLRQNSDQFYRQPPVWKRLDKYQRQYIGVESNNEQLIYGSYFCSNQGLPWKQELLEFSDGGECYFQVVYDRGGGQFIYLQVNGES